MEEILELIGMEQFLNTLPANKQLWVMERKPNTCIQAGKPVDEYEHARHEESQVVPGKCQGSSIRAIMLILWEIRALRRHVLQENHKRGDKQTEDHSVLQLWKTRSPSKEVMRYCLDMNQSTR